MLQMGHRNFFSVNIQDLLRLTCGKLRYGQEVIDRATSSLKEQARIEHSFPGMIMWKVDQRQIAYRKDGL